MISVMTVRDRQIEYTGYIGEVGQAIEREVMFLRGTLRDVLRELEEGSSPRRVARFLEERVQEVEINLDDVRDVDMNDMMNIAPPIGVTLGAERVSQVLDLEDLMLQRSLRGGKMDSSCEFSGAFRVSFYIEC